MRWRKGLHPGLFFFMLLSMAACGKNDGPGRPNVLLILADDMGYSDLGCHGNKVLETPSLDQLAGESMCFSQFYVTPVCATTRASLLTGRHFLRTGVSHVHGGKDFLHLDENTLAEGFSQAGYRTGMWGKWHSGKTPGYFPWERGFDEAYMAALYSHQDNQGKMNGSSMPLEGWTTEALTDLALDFIRKNQDEAFFAYVPYLACHAPLDAPQSLVQKYQEKGLSKALASLYAMLEQMDQQIGRLLQGLEQLKLAEKTLVIFMSDNGPAVLNGVLSEQDRRIRYVNGLRGHKGNIWENGIRSPLFIRWKKQIPARTVDCLADVCDLYPTLMELAGRESRSTDLPLDGRSLVPILMNKVGKMEEKWTFLYANPGWPPSGQPWSPEGVKDEYRPWKANPGSALNLDKQIIGIRGDRYKLLQNPGPSKGTITPFLSGHVLVDIREDPGEHHNLLRDKPVLYQDLMNRLELWYAGILQEEHAFEMPVFRIGSDREKASPVLAYAPAFASPGVYSAFNYLHGFQKQGDSAMFRLEVEKGGRYAAEISYQMEAGHSCAFVLRSGEEEVPVILEGGVSALSVKDLPLSGGFTTFTLIRRDEKEPVELRIREIRLSIQEEI